MKKYNLKKLISEQSVFDALRSLISPVKDAISNFDIPETKEDAERAEEWDEIQKQIQEFWNEYPQFLPQTEKELDQFEKWLKTNKRRLTRNNTKQRLAQAYMGKNTTLKYSSEVQSLLSNIAEVYKDDIFKNMKADEFEKILKKALAESKGNIEKAKHVLLKFVLDRFNHILPWKLGNKYKGKEGVENPLEYNSDLISRALGLPKEYISSRIKEKIAEMQKIASQEKEEQLKLGPLGEKLLSMVVDEFTKKHNQSKDDKELLSKIRDIVIKTIKNNMYYDLDDQKDFDELKKIALRNVESKLKNAPRTSEEKSSPKVQEIMDSLMKKYPEWDEQKLKKITTELISDYNEDELKPGTEEIKSLLTSIISKMNE